MFAGLAVEDDDDASSEEEEPTSKPIPAPARPEASVLPEADDEAACDAPPLSQSHPSVEALGGSATLLGGIDPDDLDITISTLNAVAADLTLFRSLPFKPLRQALRPLAEELLGSGGAKQRGRGGRDGKKGGTRLDGLSPEERLKQMDRDALNHRVLRAERLARLDQLALEEGAEEGAPRLLGGPSTDVARMGSRAGTAASQPAAGGGAQLADGPAGVNLGGVLPDVAPATLNYAQSCYICKAPYRELHAFYAALCPGCAELNWRKRDEACDLRGRVALVTGGRMKIGFRVALKLLRCGATVICTTRFPMDGARRFAAQPDAASWLARLHIVGADFRDLKGLEAQLLERPALFEDSGPSARPAASVDARASPHRGAPPLQLDSLPWPQELASGCAEDDVGTCDRQEAMCDALPDLVPRLDMIINNACQTVRQP
eukprot:Transcript_9723.p1 GENE.Transcript_9723~~Transcript_9723.p1  ORF type:complete len:433 (+),score=138.74 Transcript_9723:34-1332(+)